MRVIDRGAQSRIDETRQVVARTAEEWNALWRQHAPERPAPSVDFAREMVAGVFFGSQNSGGYAIEIVGASAKGGSLVVQYRETRPGRDALAAQVITSPFHLAALPRADGDVKFERVP